ncbi:MAG: glycosyltransferase [Candidatus Omnitrophota bacterium]
MAKIIIFNASSSIYGAERGLINLVKTLKGKYEISVVLPDKGPLEQLLKRWGVNTKIFPLAVVMFSLSPLYYIRFLGRSVTNLVYFTLYVKREKIDIICSNSLLLLFPAIVAKLNRRKSVWYIREFLSNKIADFILGFFVKCFADKVICQSEVIRRKLNLINKAKVIYEPFDKANYKMYDCEDIKKAWNLPRDITIVSCVSRLHPSKGQYEFINQVKDILGKRRDIFLFIAGDITPPTARNILYRKKIERLIKKNKLKNILLLGWRSDVDKIYSISDICVFPFLREEPFGIAVVEALCFGKLTFFPQNGGAKEIRDIFKRGRLFDINKIRDVICNFKAMATTELSSFHVPLALSPVIYNQEISSLFSDLK